MSEVYRARDTVIGRTVAVKILTEAGSADPDAKARFLRNPPGRQHRARQRISIYDFGEDAQQRPYMVMEFLRGVDLRHAIATAISVISRPGCESVCRIARALGYIHSLDIIHRDIKPENIHLTSSGVVKLMDFGIASSGAVDDAYRIRDGHAVLHGARTGARQEHRSPVDIYAFGVLFFELLTGVRPVSGDTIERIFYAILNEPLNLAPLRGTVPHRYAI